MEFDYIPNKKKKTTKDVFSNVKEMPKNMMEKIKKTVEEMKKKGKKLTPELKKLLTKALAGSLVAGMLFMAGCAKTPVEQAYSRNIAKLIDSVDYEEKLNEYNDLELDFQQRFAEKDNMWNEKFQSGEIETNAKGDLLCDPSVIEELNRDFTVHFGEEYLGLKFFPEDYYVNKLDVPAEDIHMYANVTRWYTTDAGDLYMNVVAYDDYWRQTNGYYVLKTLFKYHIGDDLCEEIVKVYDDNQGDPEKNTIGGFAYRYLLNYIIDNYEPEVLAEMYGRNKEDESLFYGGENFMPDGDSLVTFKNGYLQEYTLARVRGNGYGNSTYEIVLAEYPEIKKDVVPSSQMHNGIMIVPSYETFTELDYYYEDPLDHRYLESEEWFEKGWVNKDWFNALSLRLIDASEIKRMGKKVYSDSKDAYYDTGWYDKRFIKDYEYYKEKSKSK